MKRKALKVSILAMTAIIGYVASYLAIRVIKPEFLNTNDGPVVAFTRFYHPLCYVSADRPEWHSRVRDGWLEIQIDWINVGNGYLYFLWDGHETRAAWIADLHDFKEGDVVLAHFRYELVTWDDFSSRLVPYIDMVKPPNKGAAANRRPAGQSDGGDNLAAIVAADPAFPAAVAELDRSAPLRTFHSDFTASCRRNLCPGRQTDIGS